jgi:hypothetical protein
MSEPSFQSLTCYNHPDRQTYLRCNRCDRPICTSCAIQTPTGYRCKECVRGQQKVYETARSLDPVLGFVVAAVIAFPGSYLAQVLQFFTLFLAPILGLLIIEAVRWVVSRRRSRSLFIATAAGAALGSLPFLVIRLVAILAAGSLGLGGIMSLVWQAAFAFLITTTVYYRISGIQL